MNAIFSLFAQIGLQPDAATVAIIAAVVAVYFSTLGKDYLLHVVMSAIVALVLTPLIGPTIVQTLSINWQPETLRAVTFAVLLVLAQFGFMRSPFAYPLSTPRGYVRILWLVVAAGLLSACLFALSVLPATTPLVVKVFAGEWSLPIWIGAAWVLLAFFKGND